MNFHFVFLSYPMGLKTLTVPTSELITHRLLQLVSTTKGETALLFGFAVMSHSQVTPMDIGTVRALVQEMNSRAPGDQARDARRAPRSTSARHEHRCEARSLCLWD